MQSENPQISNMYTTVTSVVKTMMDCFIKPDVFKNTAIYDIDFKNPRNMLLWKKCIFVPQ